jgi:acyl transferase domain-containing protein
MLSVDSLNAFESLIAAGELAVASNNSPRQYVVSGSIDRIEEAVRLAQAQGIAHQRLKTSHAFHSPMMRTAAQELLGFLSLTAFGTARIPIVSNITGRLLTEYEYKNPAYWADHLVRTVQFASSVDTLSELGVRHFIEVGHGYAMSNLVRANLRNVAAKDAVIVQALGGAEAEYAVYLDAVAMAWTLSPNVDVDPHISGRRKVQLPVYPFARKSHWVKPVIGFQSRYRQEPAASQPIPFSAVLTCETVVPVNQVRAPEQCQQPTGAQPANEGNPVEAVVADIYRAFLGSEDLDRDLTFFELGGNSLVAIQLINRLREIFQIDIPLRGFYQHSSIMAISHQIAEKLLEEPANV